MSYSLGDRDLDFSKWKVADLRKELKSRGLSVEGKKNELVERLQLAVGDSSFLDDANDQDEILDEDVLTDDEPFEDSELAGVDTPEKITEKSKAEIGIKRKSTEINESSLKQPKKIILNRNNLSVEKIVCNIEGKENQEKTEGKTIEAEKKNVVKVEPLTTQERLERRAAKFGVAMSNEAKKEARAARFGLPITASKVGGVVNTNIAVLKKRAQRFGTTLPGSLLESSELEERKKKREERFGKVEKISSQPTFRRNYSFQKSSFDEKKRLRAERFKIKK